MSNVLERIICKQINTYRGDKISNCVTGFCISHETRHYLVIMLERWKQAIHEEEYLSVMNMDLSKAFDIINHGLLLAKLRTWILFFYLFILYFNLVENHKKKAQ